MSHAEFWSAFWTAFWANLPATIFALGALIASIRSRVHQARLYRQIQGRMTELIRTTDGQARAEGVAEGVERERERRTPMGPAPRGTDRG